MGVGHLLLKHVSQVASWSQTGMENNKHLTPPARKSSWYWCVTPLIYVWLNYGQDWGFARNEMINFCRRHISLRRRSVLWPWYICALVCMSQDEFLEKSVGKVNHLRTSCVSAFSPFSLFWPVWSVHMSSCHSHVHFSTLYASLIEVWLFVPWGILWIL
jgi:hypothetical protein